MGACERRRVPGATAGRGRPRPADPIPEEIRSLHKESLVVDLHVDTLLWMRTLGYRIDRRHLNPLPTRPFLGHVDLPRAAEGGLDGAVLGIVVNPRRTRDELMLPLRLLSRLERGRGIEQTLTTLELLASAAGELAGRMAFVRSGSELRAAAREGRFAGLAGLEGAHGIEGDLDNLRRAHQRGLRLLGLVHFQANEAAFPMTRREFDARGLTPFGFELVDELERLGIVVDIAHLNARGIDDVLGVATRPFVVSHTACRALRDHRRNLEDQQIRRIADRGGVIGIAAGRMFLGRGSLDTFVDHVEHVIRTGGADAVALGSDWDGAIVPVRGMGDVTCLPRVTERLLARGHSPEVVRKALGENALRVIDAVCG